jgi:hypothetical protein
MNACELTEWATSHAKDAAIAGYIRWRNQHAARSATSPSAPRSGDRITYRKLPDEASGLVIEQFCGSIGLNQQKSGQSVVTGGRA